MPSQAGRFQRTARTLCGSEASDSALFCISPEYSAAEVKHFFEAMINMISNIGLHRTRLFGPIRFRIYELAKGRTDWGSLVIRRCATGTTENRATAEAVHKMTLPIGLMGLGICTTSAVAAIYDWFSANTAIRGVSLPAMIEKQSSRCLKQSTGPMEAAWQQNLQKPNRWTSLHLNSRQIMREAIPTRIMCFAGRTTATVDIAIRMFNGSSVAISHWKHTPTMSVPRQYSSASF